MAGNETVEVQEEIPFDFKCLFANLMGRSRDMLEEPELYNEDEREALQKDIKKTLADLEETRTLDHV